MTTTSEAATEAMQEARTKWIQTMYRRAVIANDQVGAVHIAYEAGWRAALAWAEHENRALAQRLGLAEGLLQEIADDSIDPSGNIGHWMMNPAYLVGLRERIANILATEPTREETGEG